MGQLWTGSGLTLLGFGMQWYFAGHWTLWAGPSRGDRKELEAEGQVFGINQGVSEMHARKEAKVLED